MTKDDVSVHISGPYWVRMNWDFWKGLLVGLFIGAAITLIITGMYAWALIGGIPLVGGAIKYGIKKKLNIAPKKHKKLKY
jgi:hypothetical protein